MIKIRPTDLDRQFDINSIYGAWRDELLELREQFLSANPYPHVVIDNFFRKEYAETLHAEFPKVDDKWHHYYNPIEIKYAYDRIDSFPDIYRDLFYLFCQDVTVDLMKQITGIDNLEHDVYLHGAGLHYHPRGGKLDMHVDYGLHPYQKKERRLNLIVYMNKEWQESWGGNIELWREGMSAPGVKIAPLFNRAILFRTTDESWHGFPEQIQCPVDQGRKSIAMYWISDPRSNIVPRMKAMYVGRPQDPSDPRLTLLREIRVHRRITEEDLADIYPDWELDYNVESALDG